MKALTKGDIQLLRWVRDNRPTHPIRWARRRSRTVGPNRGYSWFDHDQVITPRAKRLLDSGMLVNPADVDPSRVGGTAELTALGARVLVVYAEHLREHRDADTALSRTTIDWQQGRL